MRWQLILGFTGLLVAGTVAGVYLRPAKDLAKDVAEISKQEPAQKTIAKDYTCECDDGTAAVGIPAAPIAPLKPQEADTPGLPGTVYNQVVEDSSKKMIVRKENGKIIIAIEVEGTNVLEIQQQMKELLAQIK